MDTCAPATRPDDRFQMRYRSSLLVVVGLLYAGGSAEAGFLTVAWDPNPEPYVEGYTITFRSDDGGHIGRRTAGAATTWTRLDGLEAGRRYYIAVAAYDRWGQQGPSAAEIEGIASNAPPPLPPGAAQTFFAEGSQGLFFDRLAALNTNTVPATVSIAYLREGAPAVHREHVLSGGARATYFASDVPELANSSYGAVVTSAPGVITERTMRWRTGTSDGAHTAKALPSTSTQWFLAEGNAGFFDTFVLLANPGASRASVDVQFLLDDGSVVRRRYVLEAQQRLTVWANQVPELAFQSFGTTVQADQPILVERAMYFRGPSGAWEGGHASAGVQAGATSWFLAEGSTGDWFDTFVLLSNPNGAPVTVTIDYLTPSGVARTETRTLPATSRTTIVVDSLPELRGTDVSCSITASGPIVVERSMYWPSVPGPWYGAHNSVGLAALGRRWALAEGEVGGQDRADTFVLLSNPGAEPAEVSLTFHRVDGTILHEARTVAPRSRLTVAASSVGLAGADQFGVVIESNADIAVERSVYWSYAGSLWSSGTNETATLLR